MSRLVIIGNGFDLAHGLRTDYAGFLENMSPEAKEQWLKMCDAFLTKEDKKRNKYWIDFERNIGQITNNIFNSFLGSFSDNSYSPHQETEYESDLQLVSSIFRPITHELKEYLSDVQNIDIKPKKNIEKYIDDNTTVLTFNYTKTAELYTNNVHHFHGSLQNDDIVFGYPRRNEYDPIDGKATEFSKHLHRKLNHYRCYLKQRGTPVSEIEKELAIYLKKLPLIYNGKGSFEWYSKDLLKIIKSAEKNISPHAFDVKEIALQFIPEHIYGKEIADRARIERIQNTSPSFVEYIEIPGNLDFNMLDEIHLEEMKEIVFIGHSLIGDYEIFEEIAYKKHNIQRVILFSYDPSSTELRNQIKMLKSWFPNAELIIELYEGKIELDEQIQIK